MQHKTRGYLLGAILFFRMTGELLVRPSGSSAFVRLDPRKAKDHSGRHIELSPLLPSLNIPCSNFAENMGICLSRWGNSAQTALPSTIPENNISTQADTHLRIHMMNSGALKVSTDEADRGSAESLRGKPKRQRLDSLCPACKRKKYA